MEKDSGGFQGIPWGASLTHLPALVLIEPGALIQTYVYQRHPPEFGHISVESMKLLSVDGQFARVMIRYRGANVHRQLLAYLELRFGPIDTQRGAMVRGLNQQYTWRGEETEITLTYRGLGERGFIDVGSRVLLPRFLDAISDHSF